MVTLPAVAWRGGSVRRGATIGVCAGLFLGALAVLDSGRLIAGLIVFVVMGFGSGLVMARRMVRYWPGADRLSGAARVKVVNAVRHGGRIGDPALAPAVIDYGRGLHEAANDIRGWRWVIVFALVVAIAMSLWDAVSGSWGNLVASLVYLVLGGLEVFWWPKRLAELLSNADRSATLARRLDLPDGA
jgi:hypothetical protein